jgi:hypothetical protein
MFNEIQELKEKVETLIQLQSKTWHTW